MKGYRITYALTREDENIYTAIIEAQGMSDASSTAKVYIDEQHGFLTFNTLAAISILELKD